MKVRLIAACLAWVPVGSVALAQSTLVETATLNLGRGTGNALPSMASPILVSVPDFNSSLGTLTSASLSLNASGTVFAEVVNPFSGVNQPYTNSNATLSFGVTGPDGSSLAINPSTNAVGPFSGIAVPGSTAQITGSAPFSVANLQVLASNLSLYEAMGGGTLDLQLNSDGAASPIFSTIMGSNIFTGGDATLSGMLDVTYTYTPIPEPSSWAAIVGVMALGAALLRRRVIRA